MDTQGAWDDSMTKDQSATIFGLTALLSSKLIYNIQNRMRGHKTYSKYPVLPKALALKVKGKITLFKASAA
eukprot:3226795-Amphidinium_carterae.1